MLPSPAISPNADTTRSDEMAAAPSSLRAARAPFHVGRASSVRLSRETLIATLSATGIFLYLIARYLVHAEPMTALLPLYATLVIGGVPLVIQLSRRLLVRDFGSDLLAGVSILSAVLLREYLVGSIIVLMLSGGAALEQYATRRLLQSSMHWPSGCPSELTEKSGRKLLISSSSGLLWETGSSLSPTRSARLMEWSSTGTESWTSPISRASPTRCPKLRDQRFCRGQSTAIQPSQLRPKRSRWTHDTPRSCR